MGKEVEDKSIKEIVGDGSLSNFISFYMGSVYIDKNIRSSYDYDRSDKTIEDIFKSSVFSLIELFIRENENLTHVELLDKSRIEFNHIYDKVIRDEIISAKYKVKNIKLRICENIDKRRCDEINKGRHDISIFTKRNYIEVINVVIRKTVNDYYQEVVFYDFSNTEKFEGDFEIERKHKEIDNRVDDLYKRNDEIINRNREIKNREDELKQSLEKLKYLMNILQLSDKDENTKDLVRPENKMKEIEKILEVKRKENEGNNI